MSREGVAELPAGPDLYNAKQLTPVVATLLDADSRLDRRRDFECGLRAAFVIHDPATAFRVGAPSM